MKPFISLFKIFLYLGRFTDAKAALKWLKSSEAEVESEFQTLKISYNSKTLNSNGDYSLLTRIRNLFSRKDIWKPLILMMALMLLQQFCGLTTIAFYAVNVLTESNSNVDEVCITLPRSKRFLLKFLSHQNASKLAIFL